MAPRRGGKKGADTTYVKAPEPYVAIREGNLQLLCALLDADPSLMTKVRPPAGWSLLHRAAEEGQTDVCQVLLQRGANVNQRTTWGWYTPMHLALANGWKDTALFLFHGGGDVTATCKGGKDVMQYAISRGYEQVAREFYFVLQHEAEVKIALAKKEAKAQRLREQEAGAGGAQEGEEEVAGRRESEHSTGDDDDDDDDADVRAREGVLPDDPHLAPWGGVEGVVVAPPVLVDMSPRSTTSSITER